MIVRAKYIVSDSRTVNENGAVFLCQSKVIAVGTWPEISATFPVDNVLDMGSAVIMPGWVNTHTHLELTNLHDLTEQKNRFIDWIWQIATVEQRREPDWIQQSIAGGIQMSLMAGTTTIGNIHQSLDGLAMLKSSPLRMVVFYETLGFNPVLESEYAERIEQLIQRSLPATDRYRSAITPHAPYSTRLERYQHSLELAQAYSLHLSTHISETEAEIQFLKCGTGDFIELLDRFSIPHHDWIPPQISPIAYLDQLGVLQAQPQLVHCNYLSEADIRLIADSRSSVVFCPRSHQYFHHQHHPVQRLIAAGVNLAIGTDSLASNWSLDMKDELKVLFDLDLPRPQILDMLTVNGAESLGWSKVGRLEKGWQADLIAVSLPAQTIGTIESILEQICQPEAHNLLTMVGGEIVYRIDTVSVKNRVPG